MGKAIRRSPQQLDARVCHLLFDILRDGPQPLFRFLESLSFLNKVEVVKAEILKPHLPYELKGSVSFVFCGLYRIIAFVPGKI